MLIAVGDLVRCGPCVCVPFIVQLLLFLLSTLTFAWFSLLTNHTIPASTWQLYVSVTLGRCEALFARTPDSCGAPVMQSQGFCMVPVCAWANAGVLLSCRVRFRVCFLSFCSLVLNAGSGLFYEAAVEVAYPIGEVSTVALMTFVFNAASSTFLIITSKVPPSDMNWILTGCCAACGLALLLFKARHCACMRGSVPRLFGRALGAVRARQCLKDASCCVRRVCACPCWCVPRR